MEKKQEALDKTGFSGEIIHQAREVSPEDIFGLFVLVVKHHKEATQEQLDYAEDLRTNALRHYIRVKKNRAKQRIALQSWMTNLSAAQVERYTGDKADTVRDWVEKFVAFCAQYVNEWWAYHHTRRQQASARQKLKEELDSYCDMTHRQSGGDGGTPPVGRREWAAGTCQACAYKAAIFGATGWGDEMDRQMTRAKLKTCKQVF